MVRVIIHEADFDTLVATGGRAAVEELLTEAVERHTLAGVLTLLARAPRTTSSEVDEWRRERELDDLEGAADRGAQ